MTNNTHSYNIYIPVEIFCNDTKSSITLLFQICHWDSDSVSMVRPLLVPRMKQNNNLYLRNIFKVLFIYQNSKNLLVYFKFYLAFI